jgi:hypothetical protein
MYIYSLTGIGVFKRMGWGGVGHRQIVWGHMDLLQQAVAAFQNLLLRTNFYSDSLLS